jgi:DNA-binding protein HU-beta
MPTQLTKSQLIEKIAEDTELGKKDVKAVIESMVTVGHKELKKAGVFLVPGFAKFVVIKKPATKERKGINPFTKEPTVFNREYSDHSGLIPADLSSIRSERTSSARSA